MTAVDKLSPGPNAPSGTAAATAEESAENNAQTTPTAAQMAAIAASVASAASSASSASATAAAALPETSPFTPRALVFADAPGRARRGADANDRRSMGQCGKSSSTWTKERYEYILEFG
ncbi:Protein of unknown function [Gryllus bimaculatus]|nr:Protein of unknown function [Gryllus bimaculatus]